MVQFPLWLNLRVHSHRSACSECP